MKDFVIGIIGLISMISAAYFTLGSQTVLELALWCLFFTVLFSLLFAHVNKAKYDNSYKEAFLEGLILFMILMFINKRNIKSGLISGCFLFFYGIFRFIVEFVRLPDAHIGYLYHDWVTMGHLLTIPMIVVGLVLIYKKIS